MTTRSLTPAARIKFMSANSYSTLGDLRFFKQWAPVSIFNRCAKYSIGTFGKNFDLLSKEHLSSRGWTLQKRLLSRRTLHFAQDQTYWECEEYLLGEDGSSFENIPFKMGTLIASQHLLLSEHGMSRSQSVNFIERYWGDRDAPHGRWDCGWLSHMQNFCERSLSVETDKLPALSGIARLITERTHNTYLAGLWNNHLIEDLHWRVYAREKLSASVNLRFELAFGKQLCQPQRPNEYRAPIWLWASLDSHIRFIGLDFSRIVGEVLDCNVVPSGEDRFGRVSTGYLTIKVSIANLLPGHNIYISDMLRRCRRRFSN
jgi:hypothetical protein